MSETASRLTVKVTLHPPALPAEPDTVQPSAASWSKTRIALAVLMLAGAGMAGFQLLYRQTAPLLSPATASAAQPVIASPAAAVMTTPAATTDQPSSEPAPQSVVVLPETIITVPAKAAAIPAETALPAQTMPEPAMPKQTQPAEAAPEHSAVVTAPPAALMTLPDGFSRIVLTDQMNNLQPGRAIGETIPYPQIKRLYLFTELKGYAGQILRHRWYFGDTLHTDAVLTIEDSPWRTYSENWLLDDQRGPWRVEIVDQAQKVIFQYSFTYQ